MIEKGAFKDIDVCLMAHPANCDAVYGDWLALSSYTFEFFGKSAHASAAPWDGINALDAAVLSYSALGLLRQQTLSTNRIHCVILNGGVRANIIPDYSKLEVYLRARKFDELEPLERKVKTCFEAAALSTGCTLKVNADPLFKNVIQNEKLAFIYTHYMSQTGGDFSPIYEQEKASRGSTDMGNVSHIVDSIHPVFNIGCLASYHTQEFAKATSGKEAHGRSMNAARALSLTAIDSILS